MKQSRKQRFSDEVGEGNDTLVHRLDELEQRLTDEVGEGYDAIADRVAQLEESLDDLGGRSVAQPNTVSAYPERLDHALGGRQALLPRGHEIVSSALLRRVQQGEDYYDVLRELGIES